MLIGSFMFHYTFPKVHHINLNMINNNVISQTTLNPKNMKSKLTNLVSSFFKNTLHSNKKLGKLILVRAGDSQTAENKIFAGWTDIALTDVGIKDVQIAGRLLRYVVIC